MTSIIAAAPVEAETSRYACPKCGSGGVVVSAAVLVRLDMAEIDRSMGSGYEYTDDSPALCRECAHAGVLRDFDPDPSEPAAPAHPAPAGGEIFVVAWTGGYEAPSYVVKLTEEQAWDQAGAWLADAHEDGDTIDVLRVDLATAEVTRLSVTGETSYLVSTQAVCALRYLVLADSAQAALAKAAGGDQNGVTVQSEALGDLVAGAEFSAVEGAIPSEREAEDDLPPGSYLVLVDALCDVVLGVMASSPAAAVAAARGGLGVLVSTTLVSVKDDASLMALKN